MADMCFCDLVLKAVSSSFESGDRARVSTELLTLFSLLPFYAAKSAWKEPQ